MTGKTSRTEEFLGIRPGDVVSFVGGGGKSTLIHAIANRLARENRRILTTATRPFLPRASDTPYVFFTNERPFGELLPNLAEHGTLTVAPERLPDGRLRGYRPEEVDTFVDVADYLFVEVEDAHGESLPDAEAFRAIPPITTLLAVVAGLDALGPDLDCAAFAARLAGPEGFLRLEAPCRRRSLLLNKAERRSVRLDGARITREVRRLLGEDPKPERILLTSVRDFHTRLGDRERTP